jgi:hypothetical protein
MLAPAAHAATATVGETVLAPSPTPLTIGTGTNDPVFQGASGPGYLLHSPQTGKLVSWSFLNAGIQTGRHFVLRVLEPAGGKKWKAVGTSAQAAITSATGVDAVNGPFAASLAIKAGDAIAIQPTDGSEAPLHEGTIGVDGVRYFAGAFAEGVSAEVLSEENNGQIVPIQATVEYTSEPSSPPSSPPAAPTPPVNTSAPSVRGASGTSASAGQTLQCAAGSWTGGPALSVVWFQQLAGPALPQRLTYTRAFKVGTSITLPSLRPGVRVFCQVSATAGGATSIANSAALTVKAVKPSILSSKLAGHLGALPRIVSGVAPGNLQRCSTGLWQNYPSRLQYQWQLRPPRAHAGAAKVTTRIVGRSAVLKVKPSFAGSSLVCQVTASNEAGTSTASSGPQHVRSLPELRGAPVSCGGHAGANGCPGAGIKVILPGQPSGKAVNPPSSKEMPFTSTARPPSEPAAARFLLECVPPSFNRKVKLSYHWSLVNLNFVNVEDRYAPEGVVEGIVEASGHFVTIDHGLFVEKALGQITEPGWLIATSDDSGHPLETTQLLGVGELAVTCEATGTAIGTSDWGRSPTLYVEGSPSLFGGAFDTSIIGEFSYS